MELSNTSVILHKTATKQSQKASVTFFYIYICVYINRDVTIQRATPGRALEPKKGIEALPTHEKRTLKDCKSCPKMTFFAKAVSVNHGSK